jgi:hypothetical protein
VHLMFSDTSPLKEFAFCLHCRQIVYIRYKLSPNVDAVTKRVIGSLYTNACSGIPSKLRYAL